MKPLNHGIGRAVKEIIKTQMTDAKPLAVVLAGHNGSGKSTMWSKRLSDGVRIPLINADRLVSSILPEPGKDGALPEWATRLRNTDPRWMRLAQGGAESFVSLALDSGVPFAIETVFSHWRQLPDGRVESKVDLIERAQAKGYFVLLLFVGLASADLSVLRVQTRVREHGHDVPHEKLVSRYPRTQRAIRHALPIADASVMVDNSLGLDAAFTVVRAQARGHVLYDARQEAGLAPAIAQWMNKVAPTPEV